jgi:cholesterol oxidase
MSGAAGSAASHGAQSSIDAFEPYFGSRRTLELPPLERIEMKAGDGKTLLLHHVSGGTKGPVVITAGTAMTALTYCIDSVPKNLIEYLVEGGFDVWLFDWRTSPLVAAHAQPYTMDDVAKYDWPSAVTEVRRRTGKPQVSVLAHCLSSPCFMMSLVRGYMPKENVRAFVASQVALDLVMTKVGTLKLKTRMEKLLPAKEMIHQKPSQLTAQMADMAVSVLAKVIPKSYSCDNGACHRHSASFGDVVLHSRLNDATHDMMGDLIPECLTGFLKDVAIWSRKNTVLEDDDRKHLDRLRLPIHFISGSENKMFVPESTARTYHMLSEANGSADYRRDVYEGFGHLDCYFGHGAQERIWPDLAQTLG